MNIFGSPSKLNLVLVRAGSTDLDDQGRIVGSLDMPLSPNGEDQARRMAIELDSYHFDAIYSACCLAAQQTAQQLSHQGEIRVRVEEDWINLNHGLWHGKSLGELKETQPKLYRQWKENPESVCPPGGETIEEVRKRVRVSLKKIRKKFKCGTVAIVAPEPLCSIIRTELDDTSIEELPHPKQCKVGWETMEIPANALH
jgi:broad specificity phosphatase PhoE